MLKETQRHKVSKTALKSRLVNSVTQHKSENNFRPYYTENLNGVQYRGSELRYCTETPTSPHLR